MSVWAVLLLVLVTAQRLGELPYAAANARRLKAQGAVEAGAAHYPVMVALHAGWLATLWWRGWDQPPLWPWVVLYLAVEAGRAWTLMTLGRRWTTRVFVVPGETLVRRGPYRYVAHPNYVVVAAEIFVLPLCFGLWGVSLLFGVANLMLLAWRIRVEDEALKAAR